MVPRPSYENLTVEVADALAVHYRRWIGERPADDIYAYVVYATAPVTALSVSVLTEQGLKRVASDYKTRLGCEEPLEELERDLRWSVADTPYCGEFQETFQSLNARLWSMTAYVHSLEVDDPAFSTHIETLYLILVFALKRFRRTELRGAARPMLYVDFGDMSEEERLWFIERCNDADVVQAYLSSLPPED